MTISTLKLNPDNHPFHCILTTEHSASSYGVPILLINGVAYGPLDIVNGPSGNCTAAFLVRISEPQDFDWNTYREEDEEKQEFRRRFMDVARLSLESEFKRQSYDYL